MKDPTPAIRSFARRLLEHETGAEPGPEELAAGVEAVWRKLAGQLEPFIGPSGFHALLARALHLAAGEASLLDGLEREAEATRRLAVLKERVRGREAAEARAAVEAALAHFFGLLANFIGEDLTVRMVSRAWPAVPAAHAASAFEGEAV